MKIPTHPTLIRRSLQARQKELQAQCPVLAASLVTLRRACGNPRCHCARGQKHVGHYLTWKVKGKTHTVYVPVDLLPEVKQWTQEHRRLKQLVHHLIMSKNSNMPFFKQPHGNSSAAAHPSACGT